MQPEEKVKLMDSGTSFFHAEGGLPGALNQVMAEMAEEGGRVTRESDCEAVLDKSGFWRHRIITARVEPSGDGYAVSFREGNRLTRAARIICCLVALALIASIIAFACGWWRLPCCLLVAAGLLYELTAPQDACRRRMERIREHIGQ